MKTAFLASGILCLFLSMPSLADTATEAEAETKDKKEEQTYADRVKDLAAFEGLFNIYQNTKTGELMLSIDEKQLDNPFIYFATTVDGVVEAGHFRGNYRETKLIEFRRYFDRIDIIARNDRFQFNPESALARASEANISEAVLASLKIQFEEGGRILLNAHDLFMSEALHRVSPWRNPRETGPSFALGNLNKAQSRVIHKRVYSHNMDVIVDYVFNNPNPTVMSSPAVTDPRSISIKLQHSFIAVPENDFQPRRDDARVGFFTQQFDNMTSGDWAPFNDVINRWHLVKKDPEAELSEPVEPIVWWIENTTPHEWRETVAEGVLAWNKAFEAAGFKNAIQVRVQPDDAEWDSGDINYNVIRWTSSPRPPFGGYGPSIAHPLTGQIIAADIMMEFVYMSNRWIEDQLYGEAHAMGHEHTLFCSHGHKIHTDLIAGAAMSGLLADQAMDSNELLRQALIHVILHEVGHTLGLNHNMKASILWDEQQVHDADLTQGVLTGSVMDYAPVNIAPPGMEQGDFYQYVVGPYDIWAIEYGYSVGLEDPEAEALRLESILSRSHEHALAFGNDADDMRAPGRHIDPNVMIGDMSSHPVAYARDRFVTVNHTFETLVTQARIEGQSHQRLRTSAMRLAGHYASKAGVVSRQIGGVHVQRAVVGQVEDVKPFTPVSREAQREAMHVLRDYVFAPNAMSAMEPVLAYMQQQRRGFGHWGQNEDPAFHSMVLTMQTNVLNHILHPAVMQRITDSTRYGNTYPLHEVMHDLTDAIFQRDQALTTTAKNLQIEYVTRLIGIAGLSSASNYDNLSKSAAVAELNRIKRMRLPRRSDIAASQHQEYLRMLIATAMAA